MAVCIPYDGRVSSSKVTRQGGDRGHPTEQSGVRAKHSDSASSHLSPTSPGSLLGSVLLGLRFYFPFGSKKPMREVLAVMLLGNELVPQL